MIQIEPAGDEAFQVRFGDRIDAEIHQRLLGAIDALAADAPAGVREIVPGYASLLVLYDPLHVSSWQVIRQWIADTVARAAPRPRVRVRTVEIPVLYHPDVAPDLVPLARDKGMTVEDLIAQHAAPTYRCYLLGFRPGFPFLGGLPDRLASPRLSTPRLRVPAGAVGIGGRQTGVYPVESPGGWRLIGRTPLRLFDPARADPFLVQAGDDVRFLPITPSAYQALVAPTR